MQRKTNTILAVLGFVIVCILISCCLNYSTASAYSLTVTTSGSITTDITPASDDGVGTTIVTDEVRITSNCRSGYTFTIAGSSDNNLYLNGDDTNNTAGAYFAPVNGTNALNDINNINKWGYSITANTESGIFTPLTDTSVTIKTPSQTSSPDSDIDTTLPIYYGTAVDNTITPGAYTFSSGNSIIYAVTMEPTCLTYTVQYQDGGADNPNGMGTTNASTGEKSVRQTNLSEGTTITLLAPNYKKAGYGFLGWSTDSDAYTHFTDNDNTNDPIIYGPMETVTITADMIALATDRNQINMYPVWVPALKDGSNNTVYFQDWDNPNTALPHDGCSTLAQTVFDNNQTNEKDKIKVTKNSVVALTDKRDNEVYTVAKLADGKCWMIENLRLDNQYTMGQNQNDPNVTNQYLAQGYGGTTGTYGNFVGLADSESTNFSNVSTSNSVYKGVANPPVDTYDPVNHVLEDLGTAYSASYRIPRYNNSNTASIVDSISYVQDYTNPSSPTDNGTNYRTSSNIYSYGNYYNWAAAIANANPHAYASTSDITGTSICPAGWALPSSGGTTKDHSNLVIQYGGTGEEQALSEGGATVTARLRSFPNNYLYSGYMDGSTIKSRGVIARFWSKTTYSAAWSYNLFMGSASNLKPLDANIKLAGFSVQCVISDSAVELILDSNNNTNTVSRLYGTAGETISIPQSSIAQPGYAFKNWNTAPDGSGSTYTNSYNIPAGSTGNTLYAQWTPQYTIVYVNNCLNWASDNASCTQSASESTGLQRINLDTSGNGSGTLKASNAWTTMSGWKIAGWNTAPDGSGTEYRISTTYSVTGQNAGDGITLYARWVPTYTIQYDGNNADNSNGMGTTNANGVKSVKQINVGEGDSIVLFPSNFKKANYGFVGWSTDPNATLTNGSTIYGPMQTISAPPYPNNSNNTITMYAVWVEAEKDGNDKPIYFQGWNGCSSLTSTSYNSTTGEITAGSVIVLTDKRDNEVYAIAKLADGNCWMIENLRLNNQYTMGQNQNDNTVTNQSLAQGYGGTTGVLGNFVGLANSESSYFADSTASNSVYKSSANPPVDTYNPSTDTLEDISTSNNPGFRFPRYNNSNTNNLIDSTTYTQDYINSASPNNSGTNYRESSYLYSYGNYYTWNAAIANTNHYVGATSTDSAGKNSENVGTSLCPAGWHLPSSNSPSKELGILSQAYGGNGDNQNGVANSGNIISNRFRTFPNNFIFSGRFLNSSANYRGTMGLYWTRTSWNSSNASEFRLTTSNLAPSEHDGKSNGFTIRCLINP